MIPSAISMFSHMSLTQEKHNSGEFEKGHENYGLQGTIKITQIYGDKNYASGNEGDVVVRDNKMQAMGLNSIKSLDIVRIDY